MACVYTIDFSLSRRGSRSLPQCGLGFFVQRPSTLSLSHLSVLSLLIVRHEGLSRDFFISIPTVLGESIRTEWMLVNSFGCCHCWAFERSQTIQRPFPAGVFSPASPQLLRSYTYDTLTYASVRSVPSPRILSFPSRWLDMYFRHSFGEATANRSLPPTAAEASPLQRMCPHVYLSTYT